MGCGFDCLQQPGICNHQSCHERLNNVTFIDAYYGRASAKIDQRQMIKQKPSSNGVCNASSLPHYIDLQMPPNTHLT